jgi:trigger factor
MHITRDQVNPTTVKLTVEADADLLNAAKQSVLKQLAKQMKLPGFRPGKAPLSMVERNADQATYQNEFIEEAFRRMYDAAIKQENLRPVGRPNVTLSKFVPFTDLEIVLEVEVVGDIKLPDYKKFKLVKEQAKVTEKDIDGVIESLRVRIAEKKDVERAAQSGDETTINFSGIDAKTMDPIKGADGKGYPLMLGSDTFIPGFEANLIGMKVGEEKIFNLTFPKDYGVKTLQKRDVVFTVHITKLQEIIKPTIDDAFAAKAGPFKTLTALRDDIRTQLESERQSEAEQVFQNKLLEMLADKTTLAVPEVLIGDEIERDKQQMRQNLTYRGQTWQEYLEEQGQTEDEYNTAAHPMAEKRVKVGLAMSEVAEQEGMTATPEELQIRLQLLKGQYQDKLMQTELEKPENVRSVLSTILSEKTIAKLTEYATASE